MEEAAPPADTAGVLTRLLGGTAARRCGELEDEEPSVAMLAALLQRAAWPVDRDVLLDLVAGAERCLGWLQGLQLALIARLEDTLPEGIRPADGFDCTREELQCLLRIGPGRAGDLLVLARSLRDRLPGIASLLLAGRVSVWHARILAEETAQLDAAGCVAVEDRVLGRAPEQSGTAFRRCVRRAVHRVDPVGAEERRERATRTRTVQRRPLSDGMGELAVALPAELAAACWTAIDAHARTWTAPGEQRTIDQRRADAFADLLLGHTDTSEGIPRPVGGNGGSCGPALVQVTVSLNTLTGADDAPGELHGYGPISAPTAREIAGWSRSAFRRLVIEPGTGRLLHLDPSRYTSKAGLVAHAHDPPNGPDLRSAGCYQGEQSSGPKAGPTTGRHPDPYTPTVAQTRYVRARDPVCAFPTCNQPAWRCELDHTTKYAVGGATCPCNLRPCCKRHHELKTRKQWHLANQPDGSWTWTSPTGRSYHSPPHDHRFGG